MKGLHQIKITITTITIYITIFKHLLYYYIIILLPHLPTGLQTDAHILRIVTWNMGYLVLIVACVVCINADIATNSADSSICYNYTKRLDVQFSYGVEYTNVNTSLACQLRCNTNLTCLGIYFDRKESICYLGFSKSFYIVKSAVGMDYYTRHGCGTTLAPLCNDTFIIKNYTISQYASAFDINTIELCEQKCLSFYSNITSQFCYGFDYNNYRNKDNCFLNFNIDYNTASYKHYTNYKRQTCIPEGYYTHKHTYIYNNNNNNNIY